MTDDIKARLRAFLVEEDYPVVRDALATIEALEGERDKAELTSHEAIMELNEELAAANALRVQLAARDALVRTDLDLLTTNDLVQQLAARDAAIDLRTEQLEDAAIIERVHNAEVARLREALESISYGHSKHFDGCNCAVYIARRALTPEEPVR